MVYSIVQSKTLHHFGITRKIYGNYKLFIKFRIIIETQKLLVFKLNPVRENRLKLIRSLSDQGKSSVEIYDYLNSNIMKSPRGHYYTEKLVRITLERILFFLFIINLILYSHFLSLSIYYDKNNINYNYIITSLFNLLWKR